ncbi:MAG: CHAT domain-containing protein [Cyanobacteria bacterium P01_D01_bin.6]
MPKDWPEAVISNSLKQSGAPSGNLLQVEGSLSDGDDRLPDLSLYDVHSFQGQAGQSVRISLESQDFDTYLLLYAPSNELIAQNDDDGEGTNSEIVLQLPEDGVYQIVTNAYDRTGRGTYQLTVESLSASQVEQANQQAEADRSLEQGIDQYRDRQYEQALASWQAALSLYRQLSDRQGEAASLGNLGLVYERLGNERSAIDSYEQALGIARETGYRQSEANTLGNLSRIYNLLGNYRQGIDYHQQFLTIAREMGDRQSEADALNNLGLAYYNLGDYGRAIGLYEQSLAIGRELRDRPLDTLAPGSFVPRRSDNSVEEARALGNLGLVYQRLGNYRRAIDYFEQSLAIFPNLGDRQSEVLALNNLGSAHRFLDEYERAIDYYSQALILAREIGDRRSEALPLSNLGDVYASFGDYDRAIESYEQALSIYREVGNRLGEANTLGNIGTIYDGLGDFRQGIELHQQALGMIREIGDRPGEASFLANLGSSYLALNRLNEAERSFYTAIEILETLRAGGLSDTDRISLFDTQTRAYKALEQTLILQNEPSEALEIAERGRARIFVELLSDRLSSQQAQPIASDPPDFATIQQIAAAQQSVLVEYSIHASAPDGPALYIWVVQPTGELHFRKVSLADQSLDLSSLVRQSRDAMGIRGRGGFELVEGASANEQLRELHQLLIDPIADLLPTDPTQRVVFIPQGELFLVPFPALRDTSGNYLIENHTVLTAPSIQTLDLTRQQRMTLGSSANPSVLAIGNPTMPEVWNPEASDYQQLSDLPGAEFEAREIAEFFDVQPLINASATEQAVKQQIESAQILHFATHGLLEYGSPQDSGVQDVPGAIALTPSATEDGLLTAAEIRTLNLQAELVVLSACDTGRGRITGDGVIGLSRSFIEAGTPSVIVSLWSVPDAPTAALMTEFYRQLQQGQDKAQALRQAMLVTLENHPEPRDWAAFTLIGEAN